MEDLRKKQRFYKVIANLSYGKCGRTPDFVNAILVALSSLGTILKSGDNRNFYQNVVDYYYFCKKNNFFVCHGSINPQIDRSAALSVQENTYCGVRVVDYNNQGIFVSGAKMIVTLAPITDEMLIFNMPGLKPGDEDYANAFAIPTCTSGIKIICRKSFAKPGFSQFDYPLSYNFDEIDAYVLFENVFVPWERVFVFKDVNLSNAFFDKTYARHHSGHQDIVRAQSKAEFLVGVAIKLAEGLGLSGFINIQEKLGEMISYLELVKGAILLSEETAEEIDGVMTPNIKPIQALRYTFPKMYQNMIQYIQSLAAGSMLSTPYRNDFLTENGDCLKQVLRNTQLSADERTKLLNLAWDVTGDSFGQRQLVYETCHAGDPMRIAAQQYLNHDHNKLRKIIDEVLKA